MACKDIDEYSSEKPCPDESHQDSLLETNIILTKILPFLPVDKKKTWSWVLWIFTVWSVHWYVSSINTQSILDWHSVQNSVDCRLTTHQNLGWQSTNFQSKHMSWLTLHWLLTYWRSNVEWVFTEYQSGCQSSTDQDANQGYQLILDWGCL